jgi:hypothetical protein
VIDVAGGADDDGLHFREPVYSRNAVNRRGRRERRDLTRGYTKFASVFFCDVTGKSIWKEKDNERRIPLRAHK